MARQASASTPEQIVSTLSAVAHHGVMCSMTAVELYPLAITERLMAYSQLMAASLSRFSR